MFQRYYRLVDREDILRVLNSSKFMSSLVKASCGVSAVYLTSLIHNIWSEIVEMMTLHFLCRDVLALQEIFEILGDNETFAKSQLLQPDPEHCRSASHAQEEEAACNVLERPGTRFGVALTRSGNHLTLRQKAATTRSRRRYPRSQPIVRPNRQLMRKGI